MDMRQEALRQAKAAFAENKEEIFFAMEVIHEVLEYAKKEGLLALDKNEFFRQKGEPYVLDTIEGKGKKIPLKEYLLFGLEHVSNGDDFEMLDVFLENKYYANAYTQKEAYICYVYVIGVKSIAQGLNWGQILQCYRSCIPNVSEEAFDVFAAKWEFGETGTRKLGTVIKFGQGKG